MQTSESNLTTHLVGGRHGEPGAGAACSLEFLDSAQPVWRPVDTGQRLDGNVAGGGGGALLPAWWASAFLRGCWAQVLGWEGALRTPPHPGLSQAPLSSTSTSLSLVPALPPFMRKAPISFSILLLEVTGPRLRTAHRPFPTCPTSLCLSGLTKAHSMGSRLAPPWSCRGALGPPVGLHRLPEAPHFQACITFGVPLEFGFFPFFFFLSLTIFKKYLFFYLAALGLSCGTRDLRCHVRALSCRTQDLVP